MLLFILCEMSDRYYTQIIGVHTLAWQLKKPGKAAFVFTSLWLVWMLQHRHDSHSFLVNVTSWWWNRWKKTLILRKAACNNISMKPNDEFMSKIQSLDAWEKYLTAWLFRSSPCKLNNEAFSRKFDFSQTKSPLPSTDICQFVCHFDQNLRHFYYMTI